MLFYVVFWRTFKLCQSSDCYYIGVLKRFHYNIFSPFSANSNINLKLNEKEVKVAKKDIHFLRFPLWWDVGKFFLSKYIQKKYLKVVFMIGWLADQKKSKSPDKCNKIENQIKSFFV